MPKGSFLETFGTEPQVRLGPKDPQPESRGPESSILTPCMFTPFDIELPNLAW